MNEPETIFAKVHGASTDVISGQRGLIGGWVEHERPAHVPYVRADLLATARTEARNAALEEAAKLAETPGVWRPHPDIPDCRRIATAIRAMMEKEG